jgi:hypothetical protein
MKGSGLMRELLAAAEHALLEMRDRFGLARGDSISLDALEDALAAGPAGGIYWLTEPPLPNPHPASTYCAGCQSCRILRAKGLPTHA